MNEFKKEMFALDPSMRMALAFYDFVRKNHNWYNKIENAAMNRLKNISDFDFEYNKKMYSFFYEYIDKKNVRCCVKEYDTFYDCATSYQYLLFDFDILESNITKIYKSGILNV